MYIHDVELSHWHRGREVRLTKDNERLLAWVRWRLELIWVLHLPDAIAHVSGASNGAHIGDSPKGAEPPELLLGLGGLCRLAADRLAQGDLVRDGTGGPPSPVGDERWAGGLVAATSSLLELRRHVRGGERPHRDGCHCAGV